MTDPTTKTNPAASYADSIREAMAALATLETDETDPIECDGRAFDSRESLEEHLRQWPRSVEVRSDWYTPGDSQVGPRAGEYRILLATGGPAVQIIGELDEHGESPVSARIQGQDWFTPWETYRPLTADGSMVDTEAEDALLDFARLFYFGH